jgi:RNA polymerase sigma factor (sigma-70 family)
MKFELLVASHERALFRYTARRLDDRTTCEDVVNETFLIAWRRWSELPAPDRQLAWLYAIAFRVLSNQRRSRDRRERLLGRLSLERELRMIEKDDQGSRFSALLDCLNHLEADERELLEFVYWERLSYRDIALILGISENAAGIRITRVKKRLRELVDAQVSDLREPPEYEGGLDH